MQFISGLHNLKAQIPECAVTIGNFDGVHLGHQRLLAELKSVAQRLGVPAVVMTFEPQPNEYFSRAEPTPAFNAVARKFSALQALGLDALVRVRFNSEFAALEAKAFVEQILLARMGARAIIVGDDFQFGARRAGDFALLEQLGAQHGFIARQIDTHRVGEQRVSSTLVRQALQRGDLGTAEQLLGRGYSLLGKVAHGDKRGRQLGFPTANIWLHRRSVPVLGIFVVRVHGVEDEPIYGVASIGTRPVFKGTRVILEVHLFNFNREIYGKNIQVEFLHKLREEWHFESVEALVAQIRQDVQDAHEWLRLKQYGASSFPHTGAAR